MAKLLACKCGDCAHWEIGAPETGLGGLLGIENSWAHPNSFIRCKTCGTQIRATVVVDPHAFLIELDEANGREGHPLSSETPSEKVGE